MINVDIGYGGVFWFEVDSDCVKVLGVYDWDVWDWVWLY